jgi:threonine/homoserine/homoserine lactone efflux protein
MFTAALVVVFFMDLLKVWGAAIIRKKLTPTAIHRINQLSGLILIGFGIALLWGTIWKMEG